MTLYLVVVVLATGCRCDDSDSRTVESNTSPPSSKIEEKPEPAPVAQARSKAYLPPDKVPDNAANMVVDRLRIGWAKQMLVTRGGRWVVTVVDGSVVQVFQGSSGRLVLERELFPEKPCKGSALASNGRRILVRKGRNIVLRNLWTGQAVAKYRGGKRSRCALSPNGAHIMISSSNDSFLRVYDATLKGTKNQKPLHELNCPAGEINRILTDNSGQTVVAVGEKGVFVWGGEGGQRWRPVRGASAQDTLTVSPSGKYMLGYRPGRGTVQWQLWTGEILSKLPNARAFGFWSLESKDDSLVISNPELPLAIVQAETSTTRPFPVKREVKLAAVSEDGTRLVTISHTKTGHSLDFFGVADAKHRFGRSDDWRHIDRVAWGAKGTRLNLDIRHGARVSVSSITSQLVPSAPLSPGETSYITDASFRLGGHWDPGLLPRFSRKDAAVVDTASGELLWSHRFKQRLLAFAANHDATQVLALERKTGNVSVWSAREGSLVAQWEPSIGSPRVALETHPKEPQVYIADRQGTVCLRKIDTGQDLWCTALGVRTPRAAIAVTPDAQFVILASRYGMFYFSGLSSSSDFLRFNSPVSRPRHVAITPDGGRIALSDGLDTKIMDPRTGELRATVVLLPTKSAITVFQSDAVSSGAEPFLRWRRGFELIPRNHADVKAYKKKVLKDKRPL